MNSEDFKIPDGILVYLISLCSEKFEGHSTEEETTASLNELRSLLITLGVNPGKEFIQKKSSIDPATILGKGKLQEIAEAAKAEGAKVLAFDGELSASQARNIRELTGLEVIDRCMVILEIFAKHARTKEAKIQIEIAKLQYLLPRLTSMWSHLGRQKGGIGQKGEGEQQLELDRRIVRSKIEFLKKELEEVKISRQEQRKKRQNKALTAALVGYTNAGKSSLMNRLCQENVLEEDKLFATLDATFRMLNPDTKPPMILIDTVGFISNLPAALVSGFKSTLESALEADLLVVTCDASDPQMEKHLKVTEKVLDELNLANKDKIIVFTKKDQIKSIFEQKILLKKYPNSFLVSTYDKEDTNRVRKYILNHFLDKQKHYDLFVPYENGEVHSKIRGQTNILNEGHHEQGIFYRIKTLPPLFSGLKLNDFILAPNDSKMEIWKKIIES